MGLGASLTLIVKLVFDLGTGPTGFEPATSAVTGRCSNQLNYGPRFRPEKGFDLLIEILCIDPMSIILKMPSSQLRINIVDLRKLSL